MAGTCVIGLQWGDEAKGKLVDLLTPNYDLVVRYQGGANAGHTVVVGEKVYKLHQIPSGILNPSVMNVVATGVVLNPATFIEELESLAKEGVVPNENLMVSDRAHLVCPWHFLEDKALNSSTADGEDIGTTLRGIGPCYRDKVGRSYAIRLGDLYQDDFKERVDKIVAAKKGLIGALQGSSADKVDLHPKTIYEQYVAYGEKLLPFVGDTTAMLLDAIDEDRNILFEGAQGALLDVDHGTYPFVTSSNSSGVGVPSGAGVPAEAVGKVIGVIKSYSTRVGGGPFPTELHDELGQKIRDLGNEYGTTTGRPRRCGHFDAVAVRYSARLSGVDALSLMMLDVVSHLPEIKIASAYELDGQRIDYFPSHVSELRRVKPIYETVPGWEEDCSQLQSWDDFPAGAKYFVKRVSEIVGKPVEIVSVGPDRAQTIFIEQNWRAGLPFS
ncbi:MAG: adenylosuccinate synthase [Pirellulaceae bacterium]|nr:adenylosuccinate synthase [Pirellulaceae bacterium]